MRDKIDWRYYAKIILFAEVWYWFAVLFLAPAIETALGCSLYHGCIQL